MMLSLLYSLFSFTPHFVVKLPLEPDLPLAARPFGRLREFGWTSLMSTKSSANGPAAPLPLSFGVWPPPWSWPPSP